MKQYVGEQFQRGILTTSGIPIRANPSIKSLNDMKARPPP